MSTFRPLPDGHTYAVTGMKRDAITGLYTTERKPRMHTWPDAHIALQNVINAAPDYSIPFAVHVFVFDTVDHLREACGDPEASAHSTTYDQPDDAGIGAIVMLAEPELSLVAHEATHIALHHHGNEVGRGGVKTWLANHPESVAEMIGNLTALIWYRVAS